MISYTEKDESALRKHRDFVEISRLINLNFDVDVIVAKSISFISDRLRKRVRIYLLDDRGDLTIKQWAGDYRQELHKGIIVVRTSIVWEAFEKGEAINITDEAQIAEFDHTLKRRIRIKAIIPIKYKDANSSVEKKFGVMVIDSGRDGRSISEDDFLYSVETAELIGQAIARARFFNEYRQMRDRLSLIQEERIKVLDMLAHELRNPLTIIGGYTKRFPGIIEKLYTTIKPEQRSAYLDKLLKYSKIIAKEEYRIEENINEFIKLLEMIDPQYTMSAAPFSLNSLIEDIISKVEPLAEIKNIKISYYKKDIFVEGQEEGISTVLSNLVYNGINFSPENSRITISTREDNENVSFSVRSDTFIPKQHRQKSFEPGEEIYKHGQKAKTLYVLLDGLVGLRTAAEDKMDLMAEKLHEPGSVFGAAALVKPHIYSVTSKCIKNTKVFAIDSAGLQEIIRRDPFIGLQVMTELAQFYSKRLNTYRVAITNLFKIFKSQTDKSEVLDIYGEMG